VKMDASESTFPSERFLCSVMGSDESDFKYSMIRGLGRLCRIH
jgi:hypothetical protein